MQSRRLIPTHRTHHIRIKLAKVQHAVCPQRRAATVVAAVIAVSPAFPTTARGVTASTHGIGTGWKSQRTARFRVEKSTRGREVRQRTGCWTDGLHVGADHFEAREWRVYRWRFKKIVGDIGTDWGKIIREVSGAGSWRIVICEKKRKLSTLTANQSINQSINRLIRRSNNLSIRYTNSQSIKRRGPLNTPQIYATTEIHEILFQNWRKKILPLRNAIHLCFSFSFRMKILPTGKNWEKFL